MFIEKYRESLKEKMVTLRKQGKFDEAHKEIEKERKTVSYKLINLMKKKLMKSDVYKKLKKEEILALDNILSLYEEAKEESSKYMEVGCYKDFVIDEYNYFKLYGLLFTICYNTHCQDRKTDGSGPGGKFLLRCCLNKHKVSPVQYANKRAVTLPYGSVGLLAYCYGRSCAFWYSKLSIQRVERCICDGLQESLYIIKKHYP